MSLSHAGAVLIELMLVLVVAKSSDPRTVLFGGALLVLYAWYSATWSATALLVKAVKTAIDRNDPPPGAA
jgi:hypothetical protein